MDLIRLGNGKLTRINKEEQRTLEYRRENQEKNKGLEDKEKNTEERTKR